jgi:hypothetical protein
LSDIRHCGRNYIEPETFGIGLAFNNLNVLYLLVHLFIQSISYFEPVSVPAECLKTFTINGALDLPINAVFALEAGKGILLE